MNKKSKGMLAGAAGLALMLGAGGTFALWHDTATVAPTQVTTGYVYLEGANAITWDGPAIPVPGAVLTGTLNPRAVQASGTYLSWALTLNGHPVATGDGAGYSTWGTPVIDEAVGLNTALEHWDLSIVGGVLTATFDYDDAYPTEFRTTGGGTAADQRSGVFDLTTGNWVLTLRQTGPGVAPATP